MRKGRRKREKNVAQTPRKFVMRVTGDASTPFDDVFKTTLTDHKSLAIPMINFVFKENYTGDERIELLQTERFIKQAGSKQQKRIMDSYILIWRGNECRAYVIECQTNPDGTILIRMFEYSFLAAMDLAELVDNVLTVPFPKMAMVALRSWKNFPNKMKVRFKAPNGKSLTWKVPVVKVGDYTWQTMIEKGLLALLPFYIFNYETRFPELDADEAKLAAATADFERMMEALDELVDVAAVVVEGERRAAA